MRAKKIVSFNNKNWIEMKTKFNETINTEEIYQLEHMIELMETVVDYNVLYNNLISYQNKVNKFNKDNLIPIKKELATFKDKTIGEFQKENIHIFKRIKKELDQKAIELGFITNSEPRKKQVITEVDNFKRDIKHVLKVMNVKEQEMIFKYIDKWGK